MPEFDQAPQLEHALREVAAEMAERTDRGDVASYIPQLGKIDPKKFGIAAVTNDGRVLTAGDADEAFSIQSISKVFTLTLALGNVGDALWQRVGREPSGNPFNSIVQLEHENGIPRNPFINAGAIVVSDILLAGHQPREAIGEILRFIQFLADDDTIIIDREVALALGVYFHHCAIAMSCRQLALAGRFLANGGKNPATGHSVVSAERARRIGAMMLTCGHYDGSGDFAFRVGIPGKSGVGGGILGIVPGVTSLAVWSPGLNANGNSRLGSIALEKLAKTMNWSIFAP
ncbi:glutaminase [Mesorhizobium sp. M0578]|uniref:glutaminase n=1 Tax=unclassified Mesorhizobium TaxID=325217 RepID=UPI00333DB1B3